jgi:hypothetical protein
MSTSAMPDEFLVAPFVQPARQIEKSQSGTKVSNCDEQIAQAELKPAAFAFEGLGFHCRIIGDRRPPEQGILGGGSGFNPSW